MAFSSAFSSAFSAAFRPTYNADAGVVQFLLDLYGGAKAAYSLRNLSFSYTGDVVEVRRASDDTTSGFTAIEVSDGTMADWVGLGVDGYVATWYDQSGNGNDAVQNTATSQPKIVDAGSLKVDAGGDPTIKFDGVNDSLDCGATVVGLSTNAASVFAVSDLDGESSSGAGYLLSEGDSVSPYSSNFIFGGNDGGEVLWVNTTEFGSASVDRQLLAFTWDQSEFQAYTDGAADGAAGSATINAETTNTIIGASGDQTSAFSGRMISEIIIYDSDQSAKRTDIEGNINDYYEIFADETYRRPDGSAIFRPDGTSVYERP